ncbi:MAG: outer membrane lipoprotein carrier protein LolA [Melioribacteraceae bacterium]|nr:outer membrane lipoprotein carrier protein LolA [Melioribacteraceae bacterium]
MINFILGLIIIIASSTDNTIIKLQEKFESINYLQSNFEQSSNDGKSISGKFYFSKTNNYRIELSNNIIISDGKSIWNQDIARKKVVVSNVDEDPLAFSLSEYIYDYPNKCKVTEESVNDGFLIILDGSDTDLNFKTAKLWVNSEYLISKISVIDFGGNEFVLKFSAIVTNKILDSKLFKYQENENNKVIDLR